MRVPAANLLSGEGHGLFVAQSTFDISRPGVAAQALGIGTGALEEALAYAQARKQFGQSVLSFQAIQHMAADAATQGVGRRHGPQPGAAPQTRSDAARDGGAA